MGYKDIICGIYSIRNLVNNKRYIGQSVNIKARWNQHKNALNHGNHDNDYLQKSWNKHGEENFVFEIIEECKRQELDDRERYYIDFYKTLDENFGYNLKSGGQDHPKDSQETIRKRAESIKENYRNNPRLKKQRSERLLKKWEDPQFRKEHSGKGNGMYGKKHTPEARKKMSENRKGKIPRSNPYPVLCVQTGETYKNSSQAAKAIGGVGSNILLVCYGKRTTASGYHWKFVKTEN